MTHLRCLRRATAAATLSFASIAHASNADVECARLERAADVDPNADALLRLAACYSRQGKTASAWREARAALVRAREEPRSAHRSRLVSLARRRIEELAPSLSHLTIALDEGADTPGLDVRLNGMPVARRDLGLPLPIDPGEARVVATAPGHVPWQLAVRVDARGSTTSVRVPALGDTTEGPAPDYDAPAPSGPTPASERAPDAIGITTGLTTLVQDRPSAGLSIANIVRIAYAIRPRLSLSLRVGGARLTLPDGGQRFAVVNPAVALGYILASNEHASLGLATLATVPVGMGGGNSADPDTRDAAKSGILVGGRAFDVNYFTVVPGADLSLTTGPFVTELRTGLSYQTLVRGGELEEDPWRLQLTAAMLSTFYPLGTPKRRPSTLGIFVQGRYARWLSTPAAVEADETARDFVFAGAGVRGAVKLAPTTTLFGSVGYVRALDAPLAAQSYAALETDIGFAF